MMDELFALDTVLDVLWKGTVLMGVVLVFLGFRKSFSASLRSAILTITLVCVALLPLAGLFVPTFGFSLLDADAISGAAQTTHISETQSGPQERIGTSSVQSPERSNAILSHRYACYNTYQTADGRFLSIGAVEHRFWKKLCELLEVSDYIDHQYDESSREEILSAMRSIFREKNMAEWETLLGDQDVCWGKIQNLDEVLNDSLFREREMVVDHEDQNGNPVSTLGVSIKLSKTPGSVRTAPKNFGESTHAILTELGYEDNQIKGFEDKSVI